MFVRTVGLGPVSLLISMPINAKGAQEARAHGIPHIDIRIVTKRRDCTNGASDIAPAKIR